MPYAIKLIGGRNSYEPRPGWVINDYTRQVKVFDSKGVAQEFGRLSFGPFQESTHRVMNSRTFEVERVEQGWDYDTGRNRSAKRSS